LIFLGVNSSVIQLMVQPLSLISVFVHVLNKV